MIKNFFFVLARISTVFNLILWNVCRIKFHKCVVIFDLTLWRTLAFLLLSSSLQTKNLNEELERKLMFSDIKLTVKSQFMSETHKKSHSSSKLFIFSVSHLPETLNFFLKFPHPQNIKASFNIFFHSITQKNYDESFTKFVNKKLSIFPWRNSPPLYKKNVSHENFNGSNWRKKLRHPVVLSQNDLSFSFYSLLHDNSNCNLKTSSFLQEKVLEFFFSWLLKFCQLYKLHQMQIMCGFWEKEEEVPEERVKFHGFSTFPARISPATTAIINFSL